MSTSVAREDGRADAAVVPALTLVGATTVAPRRAPSHQKLTVVAAWSAWGADGAASSGADFLQSVSSWTEGTAAQLLRRRWPAGVKRPTSPEVQERLRHHLALAARDQRSTYLQALELARGGVNEELRQARAGG